MIISENARLHDFFKYSTVINFFTCFYILAHSKMLFNPTKEGEIYLYNVGVSFFFLFLQLDSRFLQRYEKSSSYFLSDFCYSAIHTISDFVFLNVVYIRKKVKCHVSAGKPSQRQIWAQPLKYVKELNLQRRGRSYSWQSLQRHERESH